MKSKLYDYINRIKANKILQRRIFALALVLSVFVSSGVFWNLHGTGVAMVGDDMLCGLTEHSHTAECYESAPVCGYDSDMGHVHDISCYQNSPDCGIPEHTHSAQCLADISSDKETESDWESTLPELIKNDWSGNIAAIAESQVGYKESDNNFTIADDGVTKKGYTRYGEWYNNPYGEDWNAMFAYFCLHYAGVPEYAIPYGSGCWAWSVRLAQAELLLTADEAVPKRGGIIFLDTNGDGKSDRCAIVTKTDSETITTVEGDIDGAVGEASYEWNDERITGYVSTDYREMPAQEFRAVSESGIEVYASAAENVFPKNTIMVVTDIADEDALKAAAEGVGGNAGVLGAVAVDITFYTEDGEPVEPTVSSGVQVRISLPEDKKLSGEDYLVLHQDDSGAVQNIGKADVTENGAAFAADSFSVYIVTAVDEPMATAFIETKPESGHVYIKNSSGKYFENTTSSSNRYEVMLGEKFSIVALSTNAWDDGFYYNGNILSEGIDRSYSQNGVAYIVYTFEAKELGECEINSWGKFNAAIYIKVVENTGGNTGSSYKVGGFYYRTSAGTFECSTTSNNNRVTIKIGEEIEFFTVFNSQPEYNWENNYFSTNNNQNSDNIDILKTTTPEPKKINDTQWKLTRTCTANAVGECEAVAFVDGKEVGTVYVKVEDYTLNKIYINMANGAVPSSNYSQSNPYTIKVGEIIEVFAVYSEGMHISVPDNENPQPKKLEALADTPDGNKIIRTFQAINPGTCTIVITPDYTLGNAVDKLYVKVIEDIPDYELETIYYKIQGVHDTWQKNTTGNNNCVQVYEGDTIELLAMVNGTSTTGHGYDFKEGWEEPFTKVSESWETKGSNYLIGRASFTVSAVSEKQSNKSITLRTGYKFDWELSEGSKYPPVRILMIDVLTGTRPNSQTHKIYYRVNGEPEGYKLNDTSEQSRLQLYPDDIVEVYTMKTSDDDYLKFTVYHNENYVGRNNGSSDSIDGLKLQAAFKALDKEGQCEIVIRDTDSDAGWNTEAVDWLYVEVAEHQSEGDKITFTDKNGQKQTRLLNHFYVKTALGEKSKDRVHEVLEIGGTSMSPGDYTDDKKYVKNGNNNKDYAAAKSDRYWLNVGDVMDLVLYVPIEDYYDYQRQNYPNPMYLLYFKNSQNKENDERIVQKNAVWSDGSIILNDKQYKKLTITIEAKEKTVYNDSNGNKVSDGGEALIYKGFTSGNEVIYFDVDEINAKANHLDIEISDGGTYTDTNTIYFPDGSKVVIKTVYDAYIGGVNKSTVTYEDGQTEGRDTGIPAKEYGENAFANAGGGQVEYTSAFETVGDYDRGKYGEGYPFNDYRDNGTNAQGNPKGRNFLRQQLQTVSFDVMIQLTRSTDNPQTITYYPPNNGTPQVVTKSSPKYSEYIKYFVEADEFSTVTFDLEGQALIDALNKCPDHSGMDFTIKAEVNTALVTTDLEAIKFFDNTELSNSAAKDQQFTFDLYSLTKNQYDQLKNLDPVERNAKLAEFCQQNNFIISSNNDVKGIARYTSDKISQLRFTKAGLYYFVIKEKNGSNEQYAYDTHYEIVTVTVEIDSITDEMTAKITYNGKNQNYARFDNYTKYILPETGGMGVIPYATGGTILIFTGFLLLIRRRRREGSF